MSVTLDLSRYAELFASESRDHLAALTDALTALGPARARGAASEEIGAAFRAVHSIKGMAAAMGYHEVQALAHALESSLDAVRGDVTAVTPPLVAQLVADADRLAHAVESVVAPPQAVPTDVPRGAAAAQLVRIQAGRLDALLDLAGELEIARSRLEREARLVGAGGPGQDTGLGGAVAQVARLVTALRDEVATARMVPAAEVFERFPRLVRETARELGREVEFTVEADGVELDRSMLDRVGDPLLHLLRNAVDHGLEPVAERTAAGKPRAGRLTLSARRDGGVVVLCVADDGRGIDSARVVARAVAAGILPAGAHHLSGAELLDVLAHPGFSTADRVTLVSGRGVGLDVVAATVRRMGGTVELSTAPGRGTTVLLRLPLTLTTAHALLARVGDVMIAIPLTHVIETVVVAPSGSCDAPSRDHGAPRTVGLRAAFGLPTPAHERALGVVVQVGGARAILLVDSFVGQQELVLKQFDQPRAAPLVFSAAAILGDGTLGLVVDVSRLL